MTLVGARTSMRNCSLDKSLGPVFWQNASSQISFSTRRIRLPILPPDFFPSCLWGKMAWKILQEYCRQNAPSFLWQKSPTHVCRFAVPKVDMCGTRRVPLYMGKAGTIWQFFRALFPSTWRILSPDALFTRIWDTRKHPKKNLPHFRAFSASIQEHSPPKCLFSWQTLNCQIVPFLPSYRVPLWQDDSQREEKHATILQFQSGCPSLSVPV